MTNQFTAETLENHCGQGDRLNNDSSALKLTSAPLFLWKRKGPAYNMNAKWGLEILGLADAGSFQGKGISIRPFQHREAAGTKVGEAESLL